MSCLMLLPFLRLQEQPVENELQLLAVLTEHQAVDFIADAQVSLPYCFIFCSRFKTLKYTVTCFTLSGQTHNVFLLR